jgi:hypothetical protein
MVSWLMGLDWRGHDGLFIGGDLFFELVVNCLLLSPLLLVAAFQATFQGQASELAISSLASS